MSMPSLLRGALALTLALGGCTRQAPKFPERPDADPWPDASPPVTRDAAMPDPDPAPPALSSVGAGGGEACLGDADCALGARCVLERCVAGCRLHEQCPGAIEPERDPPKLPLCDARGLCAEPSTGTLSDMTRPAADTRDEPRLERLLVGPRSVFALGGPRACMGGVPRAGRSAVTTPLDPVRLDALAQPAVVFTTDPAACRVTVDGEPAEGRQPVRLRAQTVVGPTGAPDVDRVGFPRFGEGARRFAILVDVPVGEGDGGMHLPALVSLPEGPGAGGVFELAGTPFLSADRPAKGGGDHSAWWLETQDVYPTALLAGPLPTPGADAELRLTLVFTPLPSEPGLFMGRATLSVGSTRAGWHTLQGAAWAWPAPPRAHAATRTAEAAPAATLGDDRRLTAICDGLWQGLAHLDPSGAARCLAADGCCPGPAAWSADASPALDAYWRALGEARDATLDGPALNPAAVCPLPVEGCTGRDGDPCLDWPVGCGDGRGCHLAPPYSADLDALDGPACAVALSRAAAGSLAPLDEVPGCVDALRIICATGLVRRAPPDSEEGPTVTRLHQALLRAGQVAASSVASDVASPATWAAALTALGAPLGEVMRPEWQPGLSALGPTVADAAESWAGFAADLGDDLRATSTDRQTARAALLDALALVAAVDRAAPHRADVVAATVERALWRLAARRIEVPVVRFVEDGPAAAPDPLASSSATTLADGLVDRALALRDRAAVARARLDARRDEIATWIDRTGRCRGVTPVDALLVGSDPTAIQVEALAGHPVEDPEWPGGLIRSLERRGPRALAALRAADALARLASEPAEPAPAEPLRSNLSSEPATCSEAVGGVTRQADLLSQALVDQVAGTIAELNARGDEAARVRRAHAVASRVEIAHRLRVEPDGPLLDARAPAEDAYAARLARAAMLDHISGTEPGLLRWQQAHPEDRVEAPPRPSVESPDRPGDPIVRLAHRVSLACDVLGLCTAPPGDKSGGAIEPLRDPVTGGLGTPPERWREALSRLPRVDAVHRRAAFTVTIEDGRCSRLVRSIRVERVPPVGEAREAGGEAVAMPAGPRLDHRCSDKQLVVVHPASEADAPPGGQWLLTLDEAEVRELADVVVHIEYDALAEPLLCPHCSIEESHDDR